VGELGGLLDSEQAANSEAATNPERDKRRRESLSGCMPDLTESRNRMSHTNARVSSARASPGALMRAYQRGNLTVRSRETNRIGREIAIFTVHLRESGALVRPGTPESR
jgi:hypothetical protein